MVEKLIMKVRWTKLFWRTVVWLSAEVALTLLGVDDLADYSEFISQNRSDVLLFEVSISLTTSV